MSDLAAEIIEDIRKLTDDQKVVPFEDLKQSEHLLERLAEEQNDEELQTLLEELDPSFLLYMNMIECLLIISTIVRKNPRLDSFNNFVSEAEKKYTPGSWQSCVTESFFNMWLLFDIPIEDNSCLAELCLKVANTINPIKSNLQSLIEKGISSRVGLYEVLSRDEHQVYFKEMITGKEIQAICPTGYMGQPGELWLVRLFPPVDSHGNSIVVTTPYCICNTDQEDWADYFAEKGIRCEMLQPCETMSHFMKQMSEKGFWLNYIHSTPPTLETNECIHLSGIPKD